MALGLSFGWAGPAVGQDDVVADMAEAEAAAGFQLGDDLEPGEARPASAYNWGAPVEGESTPAPPPPPPVPTTTQPAMEQDLGAESFLVDSTSNHHQERSARYRWGFLGRHIQGDVLEGTGPGIYFQGPNWYRDVESVRNPDPRLVGGWRFTLSTHDLDWKEVPAGFTALQNEEATVLTLGVGGEYFFKDQFRQRRDAQGRPMYDRYGDPVMNRQNSPFISAWLESFHFLETRGTTPSTQDSEGAFNNAAVGVALGLGYQIKGRMRLGIEHSFVGGPIKSSQVYLGSSF